MPTFKGKSTRLDFLMVIGLEVSREACGLGDTAATIVGKYNIPQLDNSKCEWSCGNVDRQRYSRKQSGSVREIK